jgi:hypothetical protein
MRFAYLTRDEVNQDVALTLAAEQGANLDVHVHPDALKEGEYDAVFWDVDSFPAEERAANLASLADGPLNKPFGLHSYNLDAQELRLLQRNGVLTAKVLRGELFDRLQAVIRRRNQTQTVA